MFLKKNQIYIFVIALLLITVGYIGVGQNSINGIMEASANINTNNENTVENETKENIEDEHLGEATLVSSINITENESNEKTLEENSNDTTNENMEKENKVSEYFINSKLDREKMYLNLITEYEKMLNSESITGEQKAIAQNEIIRINNERNTIMIVENLFQTKEICNSLILINNDSINIILDKVYDESKIAQVQNIVAREFNAKIENIHISNI